MSYRHRSSFRDIFVLLRPKPSLCTFGAVETFTGRDDKHVLEVKSCSLLPLLATPLLSLPPVSPPAALILISPPPAILAFAHFNPPQKTQGTDTMFSALVELWVEEWADFYQVIIGHWHLSSWAVSWHWKTNCTCHQQMVWISTCNLWTVYITDWHMCYRCGPSLPSVFQCHENKGGVEKHLCWGSVVESE